MARFSRNNPEDDHVILEGPELGEDATYEDMTEERMEKEKKLRIWICAK